MRARARLSSLLTFAVLMVPLSVFGQDAQTLPPDGQQAQATDGQPQTKKQKAKHNGGKDDVDAIGNRKVDGFDWYSWDKEIQLGNEYARRLEPAMKMVTDPVVTEYINRISQNLLRNSDVKIPVMIKIVDSDEPNAFTLPGGHLYVDSGLILAADEEDELAGVIAHEIGHIAARHATRSATRAQLARLLSIPATIFIPGAGGVLVNHGLGVALPLSFLSFTRAFEAEADYLGIQYAYKAGYDPSGLITFFEKLEAMEKQKPGTLARAFATHPQTPDRLEKSQREIAGILPPRGEYIVNTSEFDDVKARMMLLEKGRPLNDHKDNNGPTLRRRLGTGQPGSEQDHEDDRPTLKRPD